MDDAQADIDQILRHGLSRRGFLRAAGCVAGPAALASLLSACSSPPPAAPFDGATAGIVNFANWPLYLDKGKTTDGVPTRPSLERFFDETGIGVNYREVIPDAESFFQQIQGYLAAGRPTGWDVMVITNGLTFTKLVELNYLMELPSDRRPNFDANAGDAVRSPAYDPGNRYSMAWQSGITGIAYNPKITGREITSLQDLFDEEFHGRVGMFGDPVDLPNLALLAIGVEPETSTPADWRKAGDLLNTQRDDGIVRSYYAQNYINALSSGDVALSMAWSGDIFQENASGSGELRFVVPEDGALLWTDAMCVPRGAQHPVDAITYMDYVYDPEVAAMIAAWVAYVTPVPGARDVLIDQASTADDVETAEALSAVAESPLVFPSEDDIGRLSTYRELADDDELAQWNEVFGTFSA
jgi:spermidine/putrescine transport system substrate-binding protein